MIRMYPTECCISFRRCFVRNAIEDTAVRNGERLRCGSVLLIRKSKQAAKCIIPLITRNRTIATQALYSAAPSSLKPLLRVSPSAALDHISSEFLAGTPIWFTGLSTDVQAYLITHYQWGVMSATIDGGVDGSSAQATTTQAQVEGVVSPISTLGIPDGIVLPVVSNIDTEAAILRPSADATSTLQGTSLSFASVPSALTTARPVLVDHTTSTLFLTPAATANSISTSLPNSSSTTRQDRNGPPTATNRRGPDAILGIAIGTSLGGAFLAAAILFVVITLLRQRRKKRTRRQPMPGVVEVEQAAKFTVVSDRISDSSQKRSTIRPVEIGSTPRNSWFRYSTLPEVVHEISAS